MPPKGVTNNPRGRPPGIPNRTTIDFKIAINNLVEYATPNMVSWLQAVANEDPAKALDLIHKMAEFAYPKLARTELVGDGGGPMQITQISRKIIDENGSN